MTQPLLPELKESEASGPIAAIYGELRLRLGVPMVNLIFRHMAAVPGCLEWAWSVIAPVYTTGRVLEAAGHLSDAQSLPSIAFTAADALASGLDGPARAAVRATCAAYGRANPANLLAIDVLKLSMDAVAGAATPRRYPIPPPAAALPQALGPLPPMADLKTLAPGTMSLLRALALQVHGTDGPTIPSFYRHLAAWPEFLALLHRSLAPVMPGIHEAADGYLLRAHAAARLLYLDHAIRPAAPPSDAIRHTIDGVMAHFPPNLVKMTLVALAVDRALQD
ncbi:MAG: hypothetical protein JNK21_06765 [Rhodospirillaceae bacterium]|nr:hypothetical protein [Rhodospirillaceae bacterium]